jgi:hypothetical protein
MHLVREHINIDESYGAGYSFTGGGGYRGGMGGTTRGGFGGASNLGGPNMMYTYEIKPLNHTLEQIPSKNSSTYQTPQIQVGSRVKGKPVRSNATPDNKKEVTGYVRKIVTTDNDAIKYYVIQDEATQTYVKLEPLSISLIIAEPIEYYADSTDVLPSRRREKLRNFKQGKKIVRESIT